MKIGIPRKMTTIVDFSTLVCYEGEPRLLCVTAHQAYVYIEAAVKNGALRRYYSIHDLSGEK